jgi:oxygen-independent coproporphyrinogen-3 oxidase
LFEVLDTPRPPYGKLPSALGTRGPSLPHTVAVPDQPGYIHALYLHVPFCSTKCHYCDFYSVADKLSQVPQYLAALESEMRLTTAHFGRLAPETIFIGGGTPTLLAAGDLDRLLSLLDATIDRRRVVEFTVEANPNTFDAARAAVLAAHGVNRISLGAQSFVPAELAILQRDHDPENVGQAMALARRAGIENLNLDLIFGTPGQTLESWDYSLSRAIALAPEHLSCYSLTYEPNTAMTARLKSGQFVQLDESTELAIFNHTYDTLRSQGFERYEVSNYAKAHKSIDRRCLHNLHYWKGRNYLGWGPAAASGYEGWHWKNIASLGHYIAALGDGHPARHVSPEQTASLTGTQPTLPLVQVEHLEPLRHASEQIMLWFRLTEGIVYDEFRARTGVDPRPVLERVCQRYHDQGFFADLPGSVGLRMTDKAIPISDALLREIMAAFEG